jgi:hypothetical protein
VLAGRDVGDLELALRVGERALLRVELDADARLRHPGVARAHGAGEHRRRRRLDAQHELVAVQDADRRRLAVDLGRAEHEPLRRRHRRGVERGAGRLGDDRVVDAARRRDRDLQDDRRRLPRRALRLRILGLDELQQLGRLGQLRAFLHRGRPAGLRVRAREPRRIDRQKEREQRGSP